MSSQNESANIKHESISELEMVGTLLFGSIAGEPAEAWDSAPSAASQSKTENSGRKVNLGAHIAPETSRRWSEEVPEKILSSQDVSEISEVLPEIKSPVHAIPKTVGARKAENAAVEASMVQNGNSVEAILGEQTKKNVNWGARVYGASLTLMTLCVLVLGWQLFNEKSSNSSVSEPPVTSSAPATTNSVASTTVPMAEPLAPSVETVPESAFAPVSEAPVFDATLPSPALEVTSNSLPAVEAPLTNMEEVPVNQAIGEAVVVEEEYPTFNADLGSVVTPALNQAPVLNQVPTFAPNAPATDWNAGSTMEEVPVFNSEISNFNAVSAEPQMVSTTPQIGMQAQIPAQAPHKLTPPSVQQSELPSTTAPAEEYPSFNPNMGVEGSMPVSYY